MDNKLYTPIYVVDAYNKKLIAALDVDGRISLSRIAKQIGLSREAVTKRFNQLVDDGIIVRFAPKIDYFSLGYKCYTLILNLQNVGGEFREEIIAYLRRHHNVSVQSYMLSNWDLEVTIWIKDDVEFSRFYDNFILKYSNYVLSRKLYVVTSYRSYAHTYLHGKNHSVSIGVKSKKLDVDLIDEKLLVLLEKNPRADLVSLASSLSVSATTVAYRINRFKRDKILVGCMPLLELSKIGYYKYRIEVSLNDPAHKSRVVSYLAAHEHISSVMELVGDMDLAFEGDFKGPIKVDMFLSQLKTAVPLIRNFDVRAIVRQ